MEWNGALPGVLIQYRQPYFTDKLYSGSNGGIWNNLKVRQFVKLMGKHYQVSQFGEWESTGLWKKQPCEGAGIKYLSQIAIFIINIHKPSLLFFRLWNITFCNYSTVNLKGAIKSAASKGAPLEDVRRNQEKNRPTLFVKNIFMFGVGLADYFRFVIW